MDFTPENLPELDEVISYSSRQAAEWPLSIQEAVEEAEGIIRTAIMAKKLTALAYKFQVDTLPTLPVDAPPQALISAAELAQVEPVTPKIREQIEEARAQADIGRFSVTVFPDDAGEWQVYISR